jgi:hypothetical protein
MADSKHDTAHAVGKFCLSGLGTWIIRYISITCPAFSMSQGDVANVSELKLENAAASC